MPPPDKFIESGRVTNKKIWDREIIKAWKKIKRWHVRERKKWAMGLLPKEKHICRSCDLTAEEIVAICTHNELIAEIRKRIGEE